MFLVIRHFYLFIYFFHFSLLKISAQSPQEAFSSAVSAFVNATDIVEQKRAEAWLLEWQRDPNSLSLALEIVDTSFNLNDVFMSANAINFLITTFHESFPSEAIDRIYRILKRRLLNSLPPGLDEKCKNLITKNIANITVFHPEYMDMDNLSDFPIDNLITYFMFLIELSKDQIEDTNIFKAKLEDFNTYNFLVKVLHESQMTPAWIEVMKHIVLTTEDESFSILINFIPILRTIPSQPQLYSNFYDLFMDLTGGEISWLSPSDKQVVEEFIMILVNIVETLFQQGSDDTDSIQFATVTWEEILDLEYQFYTDGNVEFTQAIFQKFFISLRFMANMPAEFLIPVVTAAYKLNDIVTVNANFLYLLFQFIDIVIFVLDENYEEFSENIKMAEIFEALMKELYQPPWDIEILKYFTEKAKTPTDGVIFAISSLGGCGNNNFWAPKSEYDSLVSQIAPVIAQYILNSNPVPRSALYFVQYCTGNARESAGALISLAFASFSQNPGIIAAQAIASLSAQLPQVFVLNVHDFMTPLCAWLQVPPQLFPYIMTSFMNITLYLISVSPQAPQIAQILEILTKAVGSHITSLLTDDTQTMFALLFELIKCSSSVMQKLKRLCNDNNITCCPTILTEFSRQLFDSYSNALGSLWTFQSDQTMSCLCEFLSLSLKADIIKNAELIVTWVGEALYIAPIPDHIKLLISALDKIIIYLPTEKIMRFLLSMDQISDAELMITIFDFISALLSKKWARFFEFFTFDFLLAPFRSADPRIIEKAISLIGSIIETPFSAQYIEQILTTIVNGIFTNFQETDIRSAIHILIKAIEQKFCNQEQVCQLFGSMCYESEALNEFKNSMMTDALTYNYTKDITTVEMRIFRATKKLIILNKKPVS